MNKGLRFDALVLCAAMGAALKIPDSIHMEKAVEPTENHIPIGEISHGPSRSISSDDEQMADKVSQISPQDGWHIFPSASGHTVYGFIHIPKVAGSTFAVGSSRYFSDGDGFYSQESCPSQILDKLQKQCQNRKLSGMSFELMTFLRSPRAHVYSQYLELKYDPQWPWLGKTKFIQDFPTVTQFLDRFTSGIGTNHTDYPAYHPQDMQTRALVCKKGGIMGNHDYLTLVAEDLDHALENVNRYYFVGIAEFFQASVCVFHDKVMPSRPLPDFCDCQNTANWASFPFPHVSHHVPKHSLNDMSAEDLLKVDKLTQMDLKVYEAGLERFYSEVRELEERRGLRIHCN